MFDRIVYHVSPAGLMWKVTLEDSDRVWGPFSTKPEALSFAKGLVDLNSLGQVKTQKKNGTFQTEYIYGEELFQRSTRGQFAHA